MRADDGMHAWRRSGTDGGPVRRGHPRHELPLVQQPRTRQVSATVEPVALFLGGLHVTPLTHLVGVRRLLEAGLPSERPNGLDGAHVLELGAGLGLAAMVAAARGALLGCKGSNLAN
jgi:hypothetical protein